MVVQHFGEQARFHGGFDAFAGEVAVINLLAGQGFQIRQSCFLHIPQHLDIEVIPARNALFGIWQVFVKRGIDLEVIFVCLGRLDCPQAGADLTVVVVLGRFHEYSRFGAAYHPVHIGQRVLDHAVHIAGKSL